jgi:hypothetical protein
MGKDSVEAWDREERRHAWMGEGRIWRERVMGLKATVEEASKRGRGWKQRRKEDMRWVAGSYCFNPCWSLL